MDASYSPEKGPAPGGDLAGRLLGRFRIQKRLGQGAMGEVYLAEDTRLKRPVALKRIAPRLRADPRFVERFRREVELASRLSHPHIASVYDVFEHDGETFLVMEYVEGQTLRQRMRAGPIPRAEFLDIARQCASALVAAHAGGVLHRDLKPENIVLTREGLVKILDFGLAMDLPRSADSTLPDSEPGIRGTPGYMAPEALLEKEVDARADLFSLGVVFYEMLADRHPFLRSKDSFVATANRILKDSVPPLGSLNPQVTPDLEAITSRLLEKQPAARYSTAGGLLSDLKAAGASSAAALISLRPRRRQLWRVSAAAALLVACAAGFWLYRRSHRPAVIAGDWILMTDFSNHSGQPLFNDAVSEALREKLEQSRRVRLVARTQVLAAAELMGRSNITRVDASLGRQICQREGYRGLLTGEIHALSPGYVITVKLEDPWLGVPVYTGQVSLSDPGQLDSAVDRLGRQLREHLGESLAEIQQTSAPLARVTTSSLEALQRYSLGLRRYQQGRLPEAEQLFRSAIAADPGFAMAHLYLARTEDPLGDVQESRREIKRAAEGAGRVTEAERYTILAANWEAAYAYEKAVEQYRLLVNLYPNQLEAWEGLGNAAAEASQIPTAVVAQRRALELSPDSALDYGRLVLFLDLENHWQEALAAYRAAIMRGLDNPQLHRGAGVAYLSLGDTASAREQFQLIGQQGDLYGQALASLYQADLLLYEGRLAQAVEALRAGHVLDIKFGSSAWGPLRLYLLAQALLAQGKSAEARQVGFELALEARALNHPEASTFAGLLGLATAQEQIARAALAQLDRICAAEPNSASAEAYRDHLRGAIDLASGQAAQAVNEERRAYSFAPLPGALRVLGEAYAAQAQWEKAAAAYRDYLGSTGEIFLSFSPLEWVLARLDLGRVLLRSGHTQQAAAAYSQFLGLWSAADPALRAAREARTERDRLRRATPR